MKTYVLNVGYGEALVIANGDRCVIVDGGPTIPKNDYGEISLINFLTAIDIKAVDMIICTHMHYDHIAGLLEVCKQFEVGKFICNMVSFDDVSNALDTVKPYTDNNSMRLFYKSLEYYSEVLRVLQANNTEICQKYLGDIIEVYDLTFTFYGLSSEKAEKNVKLFEKALKANDIELLRDFDRRLNSTSLAMHISGLDIFWTGDLVSGYENFDIPQSDILKLTHHGQKDGMAEILVEKTQPKAFLICADKDKTYNSACDGILNRCKDYFKQKNMPENIFVTGILDGFANALCIEDGEFSLFFVD